VGKGDRKVVRWRRERQRKKKAREKRKLLAASRAGQRG
jgi:hypothetical protein